MDLKLSGRKAFISGSTQGIGYAIAAHLLKENVAVIINGRQKQKTEQAKAKLQQQFPDSSIGAIQADFTIKEEVDNLLGQLADIDILINNVGIFEVKDFENISDEDWYKYFEINVMSSVHLSRALLSNMLNNKWGRIIFISSESGVNIPENMIHYGITKAAMMAIGNGLSKLTKGTEVTVNTILGGPTYSDGVAQVVEQIAAAQQISIAQMQSAILHQYNPHSLLQRFIEPVEIASLATYLSSPLSLATNGACLRADGGVLRTV